MCPFWVDGPLGGTSCSCEEAEETQVLFELAAQFEATGVEVSLLFRSSKELVGFSSLSLSRISSSSSAWVELPFADTDIGVASVTSKKLKKGCNQNEIDVGTSRKI